MIDIGYLQKCSCWEQFASLQIYQLNSKRKGPTIRNNVVAQILFHVPDSKLIYI